MGEYFIDKVARVDARELVSEYQANIIHCDRRNLADSLSRMPPDKLRVILSGEVLSVDGTDPSRLKVTIKPRAKPKAVFSGTYPEVQTVIFNYQDLNMRFTSQFNEIHRRFTELLPSHIKIGTRLNEEEVGDWAALFSKNGEFYAENDFSKYDKGEGENVMPLERELYRLLGLSIEESDFWFDGQMVGSVSAVQFLFKVHLEIQRRSGQLTTLLGNTVVCLMVVTFLYRITRDNINWGYAKGDDSIFAFKTIQPPIAGIPERMMFLYGLTGKPEWFKNGYCASRFFIRTSYGIEWVYDPIIFGVKLGRPMTALEMSKLNELYVSYRSMTQQYKSYELIKGLSLAVKERYNISESIVEELIYSLINLTSSFEKFSSIWADRPKGVFVGVYSN
jgi:hypothetical protein